jgi:hypothetical protein
MTGCSRRSTCRGEAMSPPCSTSRRWYLSGGFAYLHHDVPVYFKPQLDALPGVAPRDLASHVLVGASAPDLPGFRLLADHGSVRILEQVSPPAAYLRPGKDGREPLQQGVDDRFTPAPRRGL